MKLDRRDFLKAVTAMSGAMVLKASGLEQLANGGKPPVIWLQGQSCTGCSVSLLNTIQTTTIDDLLVNLIDMEFHPNLSAAAGDLAVSNAEAVRAAGGYILVIEGAIPMNENGEYCHIWPGTTIKDALEQFGPGANAVLSVGTCASFGGIPAGNGNPTGAVGVGEAMGQLGISNTLINIPGCPSHPDWIVGTIAMLLNGVTPVLDRQGRPEDFFKKNVHAQCPNRGLKGKAQKLGDEGCLAGLGCKGRQTYSDCPVRGWNADESGVGVNWCVPARTPCHGCTEPDFPDGQSPFYTL